MVSKFYSLIVAYNIKMQLISYPLTLLDSLKSNTYYLKVIFNTFQFIYMKFIIDNLHTESCYQKTLLVLLLFQSLYLLFLLPNCTG